VKVIKPPTPFPHTRAFEHLPKVFLAGSIEMGTAEDWQVKVEKGLDTFDGYILNPRRDIFDATLKQSIDNPIFKEQVDWELDAQDLADIILMYFAPTTKAPISLLELGLYAPSGKMIVCCPEGFWRRGNVEIVCDRFAITLVETLDELITEARVQLTLLI